MHKPRITNDISYLASPVIGGGRLRFYLQPISGRQLVLAQLAARATDQQIKIVIVGGD